MTKLFLLFTLVFSQVTRAHEDHALTGVSHEIYHALFALVLIAAVVKGISWLRTRNNTSKKSEK